MTHDPLKQLMTDTNPLGKWAECITLEGQLRQAGHYALADEAAEVAGLWLLLHNNIMAGRRFEIACTLRTAEYRAGLLTPVIASGETFH